MHNRWKAAQVGGEPGSDKARNTNTNTDTNRNTNTNTNTVMPRRAWCKYHTNTNTVMPVATCKYHGTHPVGSDSSEVPVFGVEEAGQPRDVLLRPWRSSL